MTNVATYLRVVLFSLIALVLIDLCVGFSIGYQYKLNGNKLQKYFGYGVSTLGKLKTLIGESNNTAESITLAGWNDSLPEPIALGDSHCRKSVTVYGMSFSGRIALAANKLDSCLSMTLIDGPGAPLSHSFYMFSKYGVSDDSTHIVLGVLASALPKMNTVAHFNSAFEAPGAHMYPYYSVQDNKLVAAPVPAADLNTFRALLHQDPSVLTSYMSKNDAYFNPLVFGYEWADKSITLRMLRRAYGQHHKRQVINQFYSERSGYINKNGMLDTAKAMFLAMNTQLAMANKTLLVILINDQGYEGALDASFEDFLRQQGIRFITTQGVIDSNDNRNFLADGHYTPNLDAKLAQIVIQALAK